jgi:hypothetical protein
MFPWWSLLVVVLHAALLVVWIVRWRRNRVSADVVTSSDRHAYCASCGYDLTGKDVASVSEVAAEDCPECGRGIAHDGDVLIAPLIKNNKMSHKTFAWMVGMQGVLVVMMAHFFYGSYERYRNPSIWQMSSTRLVTQVTQPGGASVGSREMRELESRWRRGELSASEKQKLVDLTWSIQQDATKPWDDALGEWIETGRAEGLVSDQRWRQYVNQPGAVKLLARQRIHPGDPVVLQLQSDRSKLRTSRGLDWQLAVGTLSDTWIEIDPVNASEDSEPLLTHTMFLRSYSARDFVPLIDRTTPLSPGRYRVTVTLEEPEPDPKRTPAQDASAPLNTVSAVFEVVPLDEPLITSVRDDTRAEALEQALREEIFKTGGTRLRHTGTRNYLSVMLKRPDDLVGDYRVTCSIDGFRSAATWYDRRGEDESPWQEIMLLVPPRQSQQHQPAEALDRFTLRMTPKPESLKTEIDGYNTLDHTLVIEDITLGLPQP